MAEMTIRPVDVAGNFRPSPLAEIVPFVRAVPFKERGQGPRNVVLFAAWVLAKGNAFLQ